MFIVLAEAYKLNERRMIGWAVFIGIDCTLEL